MSEFKESEHPRDIDGKFASKGERGYTDKVNDRIAWAKDNEIELPLNADGSIDDIELQRLQKMSAEELSRALRRELPQKKMTPAEKIASVHIDFDRDNLLPELNDSELEKMGVSESKPVLLKKTVIDRNLGKHFDVSKNTIQNIITEALYNPIDVFPANPNNSNYYHFASFVEVEDKSGLKMGLVLLDIDVTKDNFEIGHIYYVDSVGFDKTLKMANKKD